MLYDDIYNYYCQEFNTDRIFIFDYENGTGNIVVASEEKIVSKLPLTSLEEMIFRKLVKSINDYGMLIYYQDFALTCSTIDYEDKTILFHKTFGLRCTYTFDYDTGDIVG